jgi:hypothetical protein
MKSKILILTLAVAILGSFAFISIEKSNAKKLGIKTEQHQPLSGITLDDNTF